MADRSSTPFGVVVEDFFHIATKLYHLGYAIHEDKLSSVDVDLAQLADALDASVVALSALSGGGADADDVSFARSCAKVGTDLRIRIDRLQAVAHDGDGSSAADVDAGACRVWHRKDVEALGHRLEDLSSTWRESTPNTKIANELTRKFSGLGIQPDQEAGTVVEVPSEPSREQRHELEKQAHEKVAYGAISQKISREAIAEALALRAKIPRSYASPGLLQDFILESLAFKSMTDREEEVTEAHSNTFEWIFNQKNQKDTKSGHFGAHFTNWLTTNDMGSIYWISGKPGSGKSTLMRYLYENQSTVTFLQSWAGNAPLCKAGFFFWTSGSSEQRSLTGLLRYLLHQLLSENRELMPKTFPDLWQRLGNMTTKERIKMVLEWPPAELMAAFGAFMAAALPEMKICLFIDGLDEFEGNHVEIINFFRDLTLGANNGRIKLCLASRPWKVFENAFERTVPHLKLQDLTYGDLRQYVEDRLMSDVRLRKLFKQHPEAGSRLVQEAIARADGVFLWVRLAVTKLLEQLESDSTIGGLESTLMTLPTDLDTLFDKFLFKDRSPAQITETAELFQLMRAREIVVDFVRDESANSLTIWEVAFALVQDSEIPKWNRLEPSEATDEEILERYETTRDQVRGRFAGLLDVFVKQARGNKRVKGRFSENELLENDARTLVESKVTYIHRTVRDYLMENKDVYQRLSSSAGPNFDSNLRLLRSYVLRLKNPLEEIEHHRRLDEWWPDIVLAMTHARYCTQDPFNQQRFFLNELNKTLSWYWYRKSDDDEDTWARHAFGSFEIRMKAPPIPEPFLCLATKFGLEEYICQELDLRIKKKPLSKSNQHHSNEDQKLPTPLLSYATELLTSRQKTIYPLSSPKLVSYLLDLANYTVNLPSDADRAWKRSRLSALLIGPNSTYTSFVSRQPTTPWLTLLRHLRDADRRRWISYYDVDPNGTSRWAEIVRIFVEVGGADVNAVVVEDKWDPRTCALGIVRMLEDKYGSAETQALRELMLAKGATEEGVEVSVGM